MQGIHEGSLFPFELFLVLRELISFPLIFLLGNKTMFERGKRRKNKRGKKNLGDMAHPMKSSDVRVQPRNKLVRVLLRTANQAKGSATAVISWRISTRLESP